MYFASSFGETSASNKTSTAQGTQYTNDEKKVGSMNETNHDIEWYEKSMKRMLCIRESYHRKHEAVVVIDMLAN